MFSYVLWGIVLVLFVGIMAYFEKRKLQKGGKIPCSRKSETNEKVELAVEKERSHLG